MMAPKKIVITLPSMKRKSRLNFHFGNGFRIGDFFGNNLSLLRRQRPSLLMQKEINNLIIPETISRSSAHSTAPFEKKIQITISSER